MRPIQGLLLSKLAVLLTASVAHAAVDFDAGADLRIREELIKNVPGLPNGGVLLSQPRTGFINHMRFRPRLWGEVTFGSENAGKFRLYTRLTDEFRWHIEPKKNTYAFPDELILDNLYLDGQGLFDGFLDFRVGRQDLYELYGLNHLFADGTPTDGSRTTYTDMARFCLHVTDVSTLDFFTLYNFDECDVRWGTERSRHRSLTGLGGGADPDMDDWGFGVIWGSQINPDLPYQLFVMQKNTASYYRQGEKHPRTQREVIGFKVMPRLNEEFTLQFEAMGQVGENGRDQALSGWSSYAGINWRKATTSQLKPFGKLGYHFMSGDANAADEDGGHRAWDPMWGRSVGDSEGFLYGTHYGAAWWSNQHYLKLTLGLELNGPSHRIEGNCGPLFAAAQDGMGGGDGMFKGFLSQARYVFPLWPADKTKGERFDIRGHLLGEWFNPGDYYETSRPMFFVRWQVEFKF